MEKQIIEIGNESFIDTIKLYSKALLPKKKIDSSSIPNVIVRNSNFYFSKSEIDYFTQLVGFKKDSSLIPPIYINLIGFKLQMHLILHEDFPYAAMGMVHVSNKIIQHKAFTLNQVAKAEAYFDAPKTHNRGKVFTVITKVYDKNGAVLVENHAEQLKILNQGEKSSEPKKEFVAIEGDISQWKVFENTGRKFSKVNGDKNPIHMVKIAAKLFGFKGHIAHGMYSVSKGMAELDKKASNVNAFECYVEFKQPVFLPGTANFIVSEKSQEEFIFELVNKDKSKLHMNGYFKIIK